MFHVIINYHYSLVKWNICVKLPWPQVTTLPINAIFIRGQLTRIFLQHLSNLVRQRLPNRASARASRIVKDTGCHFQVGLSWEFFGILLNLLVLTCPESVDYVIFSRFYPVMNGERRDLILRWRFRMVSNASSKRIGTQTEWTKLDVIYEWRIGGWPLTTRECVLHQGAMKHVETLRLIATMSSKRDNLAETQVHHGPSIHVAALLPFVATGLHDILQLSRMMMYRRVEFQRNSHTKAWNEGLAMA